MKDATSCNFEVYHKLKKILLYRFDEFWYIKRFDSINLVYKMILFFTFLCE